MKPLRAAVELVTRLRAEQRATRDMTTKAVLATAIGSVCASYGIPNSAEDMAAGMANGDLYPKKKTGRD